MSPDETLKEEIAASLDADPALYPYLDELLADLNALGSDPAEITALLRPLNLAAGHTRVLDLGCGKGAVSLAIARDLGLRVHGVDAYEPFIVRAKRAAADQGLTGHCTFICADLRRVLPPVLPYDAVLWMGPVQLFGDLKTLVATLRTALQPGGYLLIEEVFAAASTNTKHASLEQARQNLQAFGDRIVAEHIPDLAAVRRANTANTAAIRGRVETLVQQYPDQAGLFRAYVANQDQAGLELETTLRPAIWVVKKQE